VFGLTAGCTGANEKNLRRAGISCQAIHLHPNSHAGYYPGAEPIALKVLFAPGSGRLLGAQAVGREGVDKRIDVLATALKAGMTVRDLAELELAYAPPYGSAKDPVNLAGMAASNVLAADVQLAQWHEIQPFADPSSANRDRADKQPHGAPNAFVLLDVRSPEERAQGFIPGSLHIPLPQLRERAGELPQDKEIVVYCQSGQRSYYACRILTQKGFRARNLTGSYRTWEVAPIHNRPAT
jgi:rhodanese-related sulfurtransferase